MCAEKKRDGERERVMYYRDIEVSLFGICIFFSVTVVVCFFGSALILAFTLIVTWMKGKLCRKENDIETGTISIDVIFFCFLSAVSVGIKTKANKIQRQNYGLNFFSLSSLACHSDCHPCAILQPAHRTKNRKSKLENERVREREREIAREIEKKKMKGSNKSRHEYREKESESIISKWQSHWRKSSENIFSTVYTFNRSFVHSFGNANIISTQTRKGFVAGLRENQASKKQRQR